MFHNVRSISSGTCEGSQFENIDHETCSKIAASRNADFRTVSNGKYAPGCVQVGDSVLFNNTPLVGGSGANDAVQQLCMLPGAASSGTGATTIDIPADDRATDKSDRMFDGTWLDRSIVEGIAKKGRAKRESGNSPEGYFPVNIRTVHQAVFYVNPQ
jgi:hypothetical protein